VNHDWCEVDDCPSIICNGPHYRHICGLKYLAWSEALEPVRFQSPSDAKRLATDDVLRTAGLYVPGDHARDAARHLLLHLATSHPRAFQRLTRPHSNDTVLDIDADRDAD
jgi:hypothetical protein